MAVKPECVCTYVTGAVRRNDDASDAAGGSSMASHCNTSTDDTTCRRLDAKHTKISVWNCVKKTSLSVSSANWYVGLQSVRQENI